MLEQVISIWSARSGRSLSPMTRLAAANARGPASSSDSAVAYTRPASRAALDTAYDAAWTRNTVSRM